MMNPNIYIRETTEADLDIIMVEEKKAAQEGLVAQWTHDQHLATIHQAGSFHRAIISTQDKRLVGYGIMHLDQHDNFEIMRLVVFEKNKGYGSQTIKIILKWAFEELKCHRVWLDVRAHNLKAIKLYKHLGFRHEGTLRGAFKFQDQYVSIHVMSMLNKEYFSKDQALIIPPRLKKGDQVAIVSLSWGGAGDPGILSRYQIAKQRLEDVFGLQVVTMPHALKGSEFVAAHPELRAKDWMDALKDPKIKAIFSAIGGDDTIRLMPYVSYDVIRENPKVFMGFSDTTVNHLMMYRAGVQSYYGPAVLTCFAENIAMSDEVKQAVFQVLFDQPKTIELLPVKAWTSEFLPWHIEENNLIARKMNPDTKGFEVLQGHGQVEGHMLGGCVEVLDSLRGTELWPTLDQWQNAILCLETSEETMSPFALLMVLRSWRATGILDVIKGVCVAKPYDETHYEAYKEVFIQVFAKEMSRPDLPILYNLPFGHTSPMLVVPYGCKMRLDMDHKKCFLLL